MDEATLELIVGLCLRAGALMEDRSADLASALPQDRALVQRRVAWVEQAGQDLVALAAACHVLLRLSSISDPAA